MGMVYTIHRPPIVAIGTDQFSWYFWQWFSRFISCPGTPPSACQWVFIVGLYPWHPSCFPHRRHTAIAAVLPAMHWSNHESLATALYW